MKKHSCFFTIFLTVLFFSSSAQEAAVSKKCQKAAHGTYQFIISSSKTTVAFEQEIFYEIEKMRNSKETAFLQIDSLTKVKILPYSEINAAGFIPIKEEVVFLETPKN